MSLWTLAQTYRSMNRMRAMVIVLSRHGFSQILEATGLSRLAPMATRMRRGKGEFSVLTTPERLRRVLEDLGPTFVKLGQMLASRPDLVPPSYVVEFEKLREDVRPFPFQEIRGIVEGELERPLEEVFDDFEEIPLAAASMGQVHRARRKDGGHVVVKVRRPGIDRVVAQDLAILQLLVGAVEKYIPESRDLDLPMILDEFSRTIRQELDFYREASNTERIRRTFEGSEEVVVPGVHWDLTTERMLVLDEVEGVSPLDAQTLRAAGADPGKAARILARAFMKQVLEEGVFHGDLHAGNIRVTPSGQVAFLDFGAVGVLSGETQESLGNFFIALFSKDYVTLAEEYLKISSRSRVVDERAFERDLRELIEPYQGRPLADLRVGAALQEAVTVAVRHRLKVPPELVLLGRSALAVEDVISRLDPELVLIEEALPQAKKLLLRRFDPRRQARTIHRIVRDYKDALTRIPSQATHILQRVLDSRLSIDFVHRGYEKGLIEMDRSSNRISVSLIVSSLIVGSALLVLSGRGPLVWDFPIFGIVGFLFAGAMGFTLAIMILRSGKL